MSYCKPKSKWALSSQEEASEEDDEGIGSNRHYSGDSGNLHSATKISSRSSESEFRNDSVVGNSSLATNSIGSLSDDDAEDDERTGTIDYFPQVKIRHGCGIAMDYDEAHEVKSEHSSTDINSPRSDISDGTEMTTFNSGHRINEDTDDDFNFTRDTVPYQDDFNTDGDSDNEDLDQKRRYYNMGYRPLEREGPKLQSLSFNSMNGERTSGLRGSEAVDKGISFPSLSGYSRHSDPVKIEKNSYSKRDPPFGRGLEQIQNVGSSVDKLIRDRPIHDVKDMPEGRKLELLQPEENKKKKKKKKAAKDDGSVTTDENGNPIAEGPVAFNKTTYSQMREPPPSSHETYSYGTFPGSIDQSSSRQTSTLGNVQDKRKRKKKTNNEEVKKAEDIDNYKGRLPLEEVLSFIGGQNEPNRKPKKPAATTDDIPSKTQKASKKSKDKKQKSPLAVVSNSSEVTSKGVHSAQEATFNDPVAVSVMGNSGAKSDFDKPVANGDIAGVYSNREDVEHSLLKPKPTVTEKTVSASDSKKEKDILVNRKEIIPKDERKEIIPKDEIVELTINQVDDTNVGFTKIENNKKKAKLPKAEKTEMIFSKSEEDSNSLNSVTVKQKNAKNKKSKPASPTVKMETETEVVEVTTSACVPSLSSDDLLDNFIFTDLDLKIPKEEDFQVVGKKKKKVTTNEKEKPNHFIPPGANHKSNRRLDEKRSVAAVVNHKIAHHVVSPQGLSGDNEGRTRDLSPSAFPALTVTKSGRQAAQEGRRNSTGDVPIPTGLKSQDDSDIESVKSLPATQGSGLGDCALSPRFSYARMAATVSAKPADIEQQIEQAVCGGNCDLEPKQAVWKGSPTERRHSIGSSPEVVNKNTASNSQTVGNAVKGGCQDHILADAALKPKDTKKSVGAKTTQTSSGSNAKNVKLKVGSINHSEDIAVSCGSDTSQSESRKISANAKLFPSPIQSSEPVFSFIANLSPDSATIENSAELLRQDANFENSSIVSSCSGNSSVTNATVVSVHKLENSKIRPPNGSYGRKQKSVIFLDKRVEETPNLGISFGFDSSESEAQSEKALPEPDQCHLRIKPDSDSKNPVTTQINDIVVSETSISASKASCVPSRQLDTQTSKLSSVSDASSESVNKSQIVRLNGLVSHASQGDYMDLKKEENDRNIVPPAENSSDVIVESQKLYVSNELGGENLVYYGECVNAVKKLVSVPSPTNGPHLYCGLARYQAREESPSNFNINEAAYFLTREWNSTMKLMETDPDSVVFLEV
ncbi:uncharacterized protein LOC127852312 isoform X2 [Dreissena polymorpha]|nr:uncharacterized protein LOC127852312 isoform X2 [Dreissena polymorpha]